MYKKQLDGLRAILFLAVFTYHHAVEYWFLTYALPCFFVLSGFLITRLLVDGDERPRGAFLASFYARRALRILPLFYLFIAVAWCCGILIYPGWHAVYAFNIRVWLTSTSDSLDEFLQLFSHWQHGQLHLWSLSVEEQFYLVWPVIIVFAPRQVRPVAVAALIAGSIALRHWFAAHETYSRSLYGALLPICGEYILWGALAALAERRRWRLGSPALWLHAGVLGLVVVGRIERPEIYKGFFQFVPSANQTWFAISIAALVYGLWQDDDGLLATFLRLPILTWLGKMSYGLYVVHMATFDLADRLQSRFEILQAIAPYFLRLLLCVVIAAASWYLLESPINRLKARFVSRPTDALHAE